MNRIELTGRVANDLNLKKTRDGVSVLSFSLAVKRPHKKDTTDFFRVSCFRQNADYIKQYAAKGTMIGVSGILVTNSYTDRNGNNVTSIEVAAEDVEILESKKKEEPSDDYDLVSPDDLPF